MKRRDFIQHLGIASSALALMPQLALWQMLRRLPLQKVEALPLSAW